MSDFFEFMHPFWDGLGILITFGLIFVLIVANLAVLISHYEKKGDNNDNQS